MKLGKKELVIIIPLIALALLIAISLLFEEEDIVFTESECQEDWFKYELDSGIVCAKNELSQEQLEGFGK